MASLRNDEPLIAALDFIINWWAASRLLASLYKWWAALRPISYIQYASGIWWIYPVSIDNGIYLTYFLLKITDDLILTDFIWIHNSVNFTQIYSKDLASFGLASKGHPVWMTGIGSMRPYSVTQTGSQANPIMEVKHVLWWVWMYLVELSLKFNLFFANISLIFCITLHLSRFYHNSTQFFSFIFYRWN